MFTADIIQARLREKPFVPVRIIASSGQAYDVPHPDLVLVGRNALIIGTASKENPTQFDSANRVAILHVTEMQDLVVPPSPPHNMNGSA
jgi:hypothetical protein